VALLSEEIEVVEERWPYVERVHKVQVKVAGEPASWLYVVDYRMRIGSSLVKMGGIAGVYTKREYRERGLARKCLNYSVEWMKQNNYQLSALFGIPEFYHKFGYAVFMGEHTLSILTRNAEDAEKHYDVRDFSPDDPSQLKAIVEIYNQNNNERSGSVFRDPKLWKGFKKGISYEHKPKAFIVVDEKGEVVGYAAYERWVFGEELPVAEVGAQNHDFKIYDTIIHELARIAVERRMSRIKLYVPPDHPIASLAYRYGCLLESHYPRRAGGMARIIDLRGLFTEISDEIGRRLRRADFKGRVRLRIETDIGSVLLKVDDHEVEVLEEGTADYVFKIRQSSLTQLVLGYRSLDELMYGEAKLDFEATPLVASMFPKAVPYVWQPDRW